MVVHRLLEGLFSPCPPADGFAEDDTLDQETREVAPAAPVVPGRELTVGEAFGRFRIEAEVGRGGFGVVYRAFDTYLGRPVALKVPRPDRVQSTALWDRFAREARLAAALDHEAIVPVLDAGVVEDVICIISTFQEGENLSQWIGTRHAAGMPLKPAVQMAAQLAAGLNHAHQRGILHRDLKPGNILIALHGNDADRWSPRITDFGLGAFEADHTSQTLTGFWQGSPPYMAPEQLLAGHGPVDARSDVYALGAVLYEMLTGRRIYPCATILELSLTLDRGDPPLRPRQLRSGLPRDIETIVLTCLERDPARRYRSAAALHEDLLRFLDGRPILARPLSTPRRLGRWMRRKPSQAALMATALLAVTLTTSLIARHERRLFDKNQELERNNRRLQSAIVERDGAIADSQAALRRLAENEKVARRAAFAADLHMSHHELRAGRVEMAQALLRRYEQTPGQDDLRDFSWRYLMSLATRDYTVHRLSDLEWWRGKSPLAPILESASPALRGQILARLERVEFDQNAIRFSWDPWSPRSFVLGPRTIRSYEYSGDVNGSASVKVGDGPSEQSPPLRRWSAVSRAGRVVALDGEWNLQDAAAIPPLKEHSVGRASADAAPLDGSDGRATRVVEAPSGWFVCFSADCGMMAGLCRTSNSRARPVFYDLRSSWRASYAQYDVNIDDGPDHRLIPRFLALSYEGRLAALSGEGQDRLRVIETRTGRTLWTVRADVLGPDVEMTCAAFADDGSALVAGDSSGRTHVWDPLTGGRLGRFPAALGFVTSVGFHPDSKTVAIVASSEDAIRLWNHAREPESPTVLDHGDEVWGLTFTGEGKSLISVGNDNHARAWNAATGAPGRKIRSSNLLTAAAAAGAMRENSVAITGHTGYVSVYPGNLVGKARHVFGQLRRQKVRAMAFAPDGRTLVAGGNFRKILAVQWGRGTKPVSRLVDLPHADAYDLAFAPDGKTLAIGSHDKLITLWDVPEFRVRASLATSGKLSCLTVSPDGSLLVAGDVDGGIQFRDLSTGSLRKMVTRASETGGIWSLSFSPDGKTLATGGDDGMVRLWDPALGIERLVLGYHDAKVHAVAFSPDGKILASGDFAGKIHLWRIESALPPVHAGRQRQGRE